jgi:hypothetical protein
VSPRGKTGKTKFQQQQKKFVVVLLPEKRYLLSAEAVFFVENQQS